MAEKIEPGEGDEEKKGKDIMMEEFDTSKDPVITDAFASIKAAILSNRTDIVRQILCAAESIREEDYDSEDPDQPDKSVVRDKYDNDEYIDMLSLLLRHKDTDSGTLLHIATRVSSADIVRTLLAAGANCLVENHEKKKPFHYCSSDLVKSAYINELMQAVSQSRLFRIDHLLKAGIDVNSCDTDSLNSVLHWAAAFGNLPTVTLLIKRGGEVNACNANGATPLHDAMNRNDPLIVEELLKNGADMNIVAISGSFRGKSPKDLAHSKSLLMELVESNRSKVDCGGKFCSENRPQKNGCLDATESSFIIDHNRNITPVESIVSSSPTNFGQTLVKPPLLCPISVSVDPLVKYLCPPPQSVRQFKGLYFVPPQEMTVYIKDSNKDDILAMTDIIELFIQKFQKIGIKLITEYLSDDSKIEFKSKPHLQCIVNRNCFSHKEEYKLQINTHRVVIISSCLPSLFYALSTFLQCLKLFRGKAVPLIQIADWAQCSQRTVLFDFDKNDLPSVDILLEIADILAMFKINQIQFNVDHFIDVDGTASYTKSEALYLQIFCKKRFISVVPYILVDNNSPLLKSSSDDGIPDLCMDSLVERIDIFPLTSMIHVEVMVSENPKMIKQIYDYCNLKCLIFQASLKEMNVLLDQIPSMINCVVCTVDIATTNEWRDRLNSVTEFGLQHIICYECKDVRRRFYPNIKELVGHVYEVFSQSPPNNCYGLSMKYSFKGKKLSTIMTVLPSLIISSSMLWNLDEFMNDDSYIVNVINYLVYEDDKDLIGNLFMEVGKSLPMIPKVESVMEIDKTSISLFDAMLNDFPVDFTSLNALCLQKVCKTIKVMRQDLLLAKVSSSLSEPFLQETTILLNLIFFLARISYRLLNLNSEKKTADLQNLPEVNKSDESNRLMALIQDYESYCMSYCKPSNYEHVSVSLLQGILERIMPKKSLQLQNGDHPIIDI